MSLAQRAESKTRTLWLEALQRTSRFARFAWGEVKRFFSAVSSLASAVLVLTRMARSYRCLAITPLVNLSACRDDSAHGHAFAEELLTSDRVHKAKMTAYQCVLVIKFLAIMAFAGGALAAFLASDAAARKRAVHRIASPSLLLVWLCGYTLLIMSGGALFELWVVGALLLSFVANTSLAYSATANLSKKTAMLTITLPIVLVIILMVLKPTWTEIFP
jgi:uncharacterized membrane protein